MKIAILVRRLYPPGGAEETMLNLSQRMETKHDVQIFGFAKNPGRTPNNATSLPMPTAQYFKNPRVKKIVRHLYRSTKLYKPVKDFNPDLILAQHRPALLTPYLKQLCNARVAIFLHDMGQVKFPHGSIGGKLYSHYNRAIHKIAYQQADCVIANSKFIAREFYSVYDFYPNVVYPIINIDEYQVDSSGEHILFSNPIREKGVEIVLDIANQLSSEKFLITGPEPRESKIAGQIENADNIEFKGFIPNITRAFEDSKLLLYPSQWEEPFGRLPIEAGANGIPTVASAKGGLPESVGIDDCIVQSNSSNDYVDRIQFILCNYSKYSTAAQQNAEVKSGDLQFAKVRSLLGGV